MEQAHAAQKGAIGLDLSDNKGGKEMIDAPMLKQVRSCGFLFVRLTSMTSGGEDDSIGTGCGPFNTNAALNTPIYLCWDFIYI